MKRLVGSIILVSMMCIGAGNAFAGSSDFYLSVPIVIDRTGDGELNTTAIGGGVKLSTAENDDLLGGAVGLTVYYPLAVSWTKGAGVSPPMFLPCIPFPWDWIFWWVWTSTPCGWAFFPSP